MPIMLSVGITESIAMLVSNGCWCNGRFHRISFFLALLPSSLPNLSDLSSVFICHFLVFNVLQMATCL